MPPIDLRSDTVTLPTQEMLEAMSRAEFRDEPRDGDPTVRSFEALAAERTGKQAALFVASGTMANLIALLAHTSRGGEVLSEAGVHILNSEMGGIATLAGLMPRPLSGTRGAMDVQLLRSAMKPRRGPHQSGTALICMETTHNRAGGSVLPLDHMAAVYRLAKDNDIPVHTDGARLFNAAIALGVGAHRITAYTDSVCFCVSKGLSAPVGSILAGPASFIERARGFRKMVGGNLRKPGPLAAAGIIALEHMVPRLAEDHKTARQLAEGLNRIDHSLVGPETVETNIVRVEVDASGHDADYWSSEMEKRGILVAPYGDTALRFVTHRHITSDHVRDAIRAFGEIWDRVSVAKRSRKAIVHSA
jgi:threonine aldolase